MRVIPRLDIKGAHLVKGINLEGLRILGPPTYFAEAYYQGLADELIYMDAVASLYGRNSLIDMVEWTAANIFVPLTVGGGLRSLADMSKVLKSGADKVAINTAAVERPEIIREASEEFGSSTIVVSVDAQRNDEGGYTVFTDNGREDSGRELIEWCQSAEHMGAGEILLTSIEREGTGFGYDCEMTKMVAGAVSIPVIASGGAGSAKDVVDVAQSGMADAVAVAGVFHFKLTEDMAKSESNDYSHGEFPILREDRHNRRIVPATITDVKSALSEAGFECRL